MILLREKGAHGVSARCEQNYMLLPQRSQGSTLTNHMLRRILIANTTTVASQTYRISPAHMASTSQTASSNRQAITAQPKLQKSHVMLFMVCITQQQLLTGFCLHWPVTRVTCDQTCCCCLFWHLPSASSQTNRPSDYCWISSWLDECKVVYHSSQWLRLSSD